MSGLMTPPTMQPGMAGMPALSEEMLKVHIEWQIESLQHLLKQIEARQMEKRQTEDPTSSSDQ